MFVRKYYVFTNQHLLMKTMLSFLFMIFPLMIFAKTYYVATNGNDSWPGTKEKPWKTWGKAFNAIVIQPGDTVYFRGGVYYKDISEGESSWYYPDRDTQNGSGYKVSRVGTDSDNMVHYFAYPGEDPILDCDSTEIPAEAVSIFRAIRTGGNDYCHFKGLTVRNLWGHNSSGHDKVDCSAWQLVGTGYIIENCKIYNIHGVGFTFNPSYDAYVINCDAWYCADSLASFGERGTGFSSSNMETPNTSIHFINCRAWLCSDQGFASFDIGYVEYDSCWAFYNGGLGAAGSGIKGGLMQAEPDIPLRRKITNNIIAFNRYSGINLNDNTPSAAQSVNIFNNTVYHNGYYPGFKYLGYGFRLWTTASSDSLQLTRIFRNNISYDNGGGPIWIQSGAKYTHSNNTWDSDVTVTDADFVGPIDSATIMNALLAPRKEDGSLPDFPYFQLAEESDLIDAGVNVGLPYNDAAPDLGAFEFVPHRKQDNVAPSVKITSPSSQSEFLAPASITITADASDSDGSISKVEFFNGSIKIGEKASSPWSVTWSDVPEGDYTLTAVASDDQELQTTSAPVHVFVKNNMSPSVNLTSPSSGAEFLAPASITITADASDSDGSISKVEFFNGSTKIGEKSSSPWSMTWNEVPAGDYTLTAVATDRLSLQVKSAPIYITIRTNILLFPNPNNGQFTLSLTEPRISSNYMIFIASPEGKIVHKGILLKDESSKEFNLPSLKPGSYTVKLYTDQMFLSTNFIKH